MIINFPLRSTIFGFIIKMLFPLMQLFLSITVITPRVKGLDVFITLVSTTFVLIVVQILNDLWVIQQKSVISDLGIPLASFGVESNIQTAMGLVHVIEASFFYIGFLVGVFYLVRRKPFLLMDTPPKKVKKRKPKPVKTIKVFEPEKLIEPEKIEIPEEEPILFEEKIEDLPSDDEPPDEIPKEESNNLNDEESQDYQ